MAIRNIVKIEDPILRNKSRDVVDFNEKLWTLLDDMFETMYKADGCGLAAPQIGLLRKVIVVDCGKGKIEMINPTILEMHGEIGGIEGCLSVPGKHGHVMRAEKIKVEFYTRYGEKKVKTYREFEARALQHEIDHLNGILYIDRATKEYDD